MNAGRRTPARSRADVRPGRSLRYGAMRGRASFPIVLAAIAAVAISACGGSGGSSSSGNGVASKSPDQILSAAVGAARNAQSVHVAGTVHNGGQTIAIDLSITSAHGTSGSIAEGNASFKLIEAGGAFYIQPNARFLNEFTHSSAAVQLLRGKWLKGSPSDPSFQSFAQLTSIKSLMGSLTQNHGTLSKGSTTTINGAKAIALHSSKGGTMYVATTGKPYPLQVSKGSGSTVGKVTFTDWNKQFSISAPSNSVDLSKLQSGG
jgi:hypothetical protein